MRQLEARATTYSGVAMRSRLEADVARWMDNAGIAWKYEPRAFADRIWTYLPDFELLNQEHPTYLEVKGTFGSAELAMERMEIIWGSIPDATLMVVFGNHDHMLVTVGRRWETRRLGDIRAAA